VTSGSDGVDYGKLIDEEKTRQGSAIAAAEVQKRRELDLIAFFRGVEIELGREIARANAELKKRGSPVIAGPFRPAREEEKIELAFGAPHPCCRLTLQGIDIAAGLASIQAELLDRWGKTTSRIQYIIEGEGQTLRAYRPLIEGVPDRAAELTAAQLAREVVPGIIRGRFS
jgi:hypothetical protein